MLLGSGEESASRPAKEIITGTVRGLPVVDSGLAVEERAQATALWNNNQVDMRTLITVDCDHGGGHVAAPPDLKAAAWTFMKAHPFGTKPSPYAGGLPMGFPSYCKIMSK